MRTMNLPIISRRALLTSGAAFAASLAAPSALAQAWPQKPVRVLVGFAAGGNIDNLARVTCARLVRGVRSAVRGREPRRRHGHDCRQRRRACAPPTATPSSGPAPARSRSSRRSARHLRHDEGSRAGQPDRHQPAGADRQRQAADQDAAGLRRLCEGAARKKLAYAGGGGPGSVSNLLMALFLKRAGLEMNAVSYRGTAPALTDIIGGHVPGDVHSAAGGAAAGATGAVRMLALSDDRRAPQAKDVPTIAESGFPGFRGVSWNGMMAPAKTPQPDHRPHRRRVRQGGEGSAVHRAARQVRRRRRSASRPRNSPSSCRRTWRSGRKR